MSARRFGILAVALVGYAVPAFALRPYDSTDADVAHLGEAELELGPVQWRREGSKKFVEAPAAVFNLGFSKDRELVIESTREVARDPAPGEPGTALVDNGVFIKQVLRQGSLQDAAGPSIAAEYGVLLPGVHAQDGTGFSVAGIASQRWEAATVHLNAQVARTRDNDSELFLGAIVEGPYAWPVRPVAEVFTDHTTGSDRVNSTLVGAIWRVRDGLSLDAGLRYARAGDEPIHELRLGLTWSFSLGKG